MRNTFHAPLRRGLRAIVGLCLGTLFVTAFSCIAIDSVEDVACTVASDCAPPYVCCSSPRIPSEDTPPVSCQDIRYCDAYLPFLLEGQPCGRSPVALNGGGKAPNNPCSAGLVCCPSTLSCGKEGACPEPLVPPATPSNASCLADADCPGGEICCNIDFFTRSNGKCSAVAACNPAKPN